MASAATEDRELAAAVSGLHAALRAAALPLELPGVGPLREERQRVLTQLDDYVLPRLAAIDAPALVVVAGPTGVGKSTLVNSLVGCPVTTPGLLRPTTRSPVLVHHPGDREWFGPDRVLSTLDRVDRPTTDSRAIQLVSSTEVPRGLAILDAPDFDSIDDHNRELATRLLAAADLLLFVTSAARYSDQVPWLQLSLALERETAVAVVMNRVPAEDRAAVLPHLTRMLGATGVPADRTFVVEHGPVVDDALLPPTYVAEVRGWIHTLAASVDERSAAVRRTVRGAVRRAVGVAGPVADAARLQVEAVSELLAVADRAYGDAAEDLRRSLAAGTVLRGELLAQWQDLDERATDIEERTDRLGLTLDLVLETLVVDHAVRAADHTRRRLRAAAHGSALLDWSTEDLGGPARGFASRARKAIRAWRDGLALAVAVPAVSGATSGVPAAAVTARERLARTLTGLLAEERERYLRPVLDWNLAPDAPTRLLAAADDVTRALARQSTQGGGGR